MSYNQYCKKGVGQYRHQTTANHPSYRSASMSIPTQSSPSQTSENNSTLPTSNNLLEQIRTEWRQKNINTEELDKLEGVWNALRSEVGREQITNVINRIKPIVEKIPLRGVMNAMSNNDKLNELLNNLSSDATNSDVLQNMLKDPNLRKTALDMMQNIMSDEKKIAEMTELMSKMLNSDNK
ncbi:hypothetical protein [Ornithinibacillus halotolerans]|uniref:Uncharacterized protein n=1 Tax=Ornithinibacillus halotolerans TaxID=1274357 RepID=A0A916S2S8_9BACI|nr:hypothetical protein [Ornithinibacillus halotolerans]GGA80711.1 hypothetical protein GCM10008025_25120 [Ornithinibacillus halotolerans]